MTHTQKAPGKATRMVGTMALLKIQQKETWKVYQKEPLKRFVSDSVKVPPTAHVKG